MPATDNNLPQQRHTFIDYLLYALAGGVVLCIVFTGLHWLRS